MVDVADPEKPKLLWYKRDTIGTPESETVLPVGKHLLLGTKDFLTLDIRDPTNPVILKRISDRPRIDQINGIILFGDYAIAANKSGYINAFDVTDMEKPTLLGVVETRKQFGLRQPHDVDRFGDYIVLLYINGMVS